MKVQFWAVLLGVIAGVEATLGATSYRLTILHSAELDNSAARAGAGGMQAGLGQGPATDDGIHALLWSGSRQNYVDLHPSGYSSSAVWDMTDTTQVGTGGPHALLWSGTAASVVDLHPAGFDESFGSGVYGNQQVGHANAPQMQHAILWNSSAEDFVDLHPEGFFQSIATGIHGNHQVGYGDNRALLWSGSAESVVNLHPRGYSSSRADGVSSTHAVGSARLAGTAHAFAWFLDSTRAVDLHPAGYSYSWGWDAAGRWQVGYGDSNAPEPGGEHALVWQGTAASVVDLHEFVPSVYDNSVAYGVDSDGNVFGTIAIGDAFHDSIAVMWSPVPEPTSLCLLLLGCLFFKRQRNAGSVLATGLRPRRLKTSARGD